VFGVVGTLQNVAVISSMQNTPVAGTWDGADSALWLPDWNSPFDVTACAATGAAAMTSTATNASFFMHQPSDPAIEQ
jgi:hypothetical protein